MKFVPYHCNQHIWVTSFTLVTASSLQQQLANQMQNKYFSLPTVGYQVGTRQSLSLHEWGFGNRFHIDYQQPTATPCNQPGSAHFSSVTGCCQIVPDKSQSQAICIHSLSLSDRASHQ